MAEVQEFGIVEIEGLSAQIAARVRADRFRPSVIVYIECGARMLAASVSRELDLPVIPLVIQRSSTRWKRLAVWVARILPASACNKLRILESRLSARRRRTPSAAAIESRMDLGDCRVLILDDAADSGNTIGGARRWAVECGAAPEDVRVAVVTATQAAARGIVDYHLFEELCRFPWSTDSREYKPYLELAGRLSGELLARRWSR